MAPIRASGWKVLMNDLKNTYGLGQGIRSMRRERARLSRFDVSHVLQISVLDGLRCCGRHLAERAVGLHWCAISGSAIVHLYGWARVVTLTQRGCVCISGVMENAGDDQSTLE